MTHPRHWPPGDPRHQWRWDRHGRRMGHGHGHDHEHEHEHEHGHGHGPGGEHWAYWRQRYALYRRSFGPLRRRMFLWFGLTILLTGAVAVAAMMIVSRPSSTWDRNKMER